MAGRPESALADKLYVELPSRRRKQAHQPRSLLLVDALKTAGREILEKEGRKGLSVQRLAERSGVAISSFYYYFPTMDAFVAGIFEDYRKEAYRSISRNIRALPPAATLFDGLVEILRTALTVLHKLASMDPTISAKSVHYKELMRLELVKSDATPPVPAVQSLLARFSDEIVARDPEKAWFFFYQMMLALPRSMALEKPQYLDQANTPYLLARMAHALLTATD